MYLIMFAAFFGTLTARDLPPKTEWDEPVKFNPIFVHVNENRCRWVHIYMGSSESIDHLSPNGGHMVKVCPGGAL